MESEHTEPVPNRNRFSIPNPTYQYVLLFLDFEDCFLAQGKV